eukprot:comp20894_c0_seq3/m.43477 comp20894_c0_seq3/g.43477  ORF comp20894_c0_seq3/g.43477 comp20894_c0_seq3/m.43477 type:complete len:221 (+) comp20894_c0_seq3:123-785(+)
MSSSFFHFDGLSPMSGVMKHNSSPLKPRLAGTNWDTNIARKAVFSPRDGEFDVKGGMVNNVANVTAVSVDPHLQNNTNSLNTDYGAEAGFKPWAHNPATTASTIASTSTSGSILLGTSSAPEMAVFPPQFDNHGLSMHPSNTPSSAAAAAAAAADVPCGLFDGDSDCADGLCCCARPVVVVVVDTADGCEHDADGAHAASAVGACWHLGHDPQHDQVQLD